MGADQTENRNTAILTSDSLNKQKTLAIKNWLKNSLGQRKGTNGVKRTGWVGTTWHSFLSYNFCLTVQMHPAAQVWSITAKAGIPDPSSQPTERFSSTTCLEWGMPTPLEFWKRNSWQQYPSPFVELLFCIQPGSTKILHSASVHVAQRENIWSKQTMHWKNIFLHSAERVCE